MEDQISKEIETYIDKELSIRKQIKTNWKEYADIYPVKYLNGRKFEYCAKTAFENIGVLNPQVLEIGAGKDSRYKDYFCGYLQYDSLDPYCNGTLSWEHAIGLEGCFDFVICQNAIGYLCKSEMETVIRLISENGIFIFNSFIIKPEDRLIRPYSSIQGKSGYEIITSFYDGVSHSLVPNDEDYIVQHLIGHWTYEEIIKVVNKIGNKKVMTFQYYINSMAYVIGHPETLRRIVHL